MPNHIFRSETSTIQRDADIDYMRECGNAYGAIGRGDMAGLLDEASRVLEKSSFRYGGFFLTANQGLPVGDAGIIITSKQFMTHGTPLPIDEMIWSIAVKSVRPPSIRAESDSSSAGSPQYYTVEIPLSIPIAVTGFSTFPPNPNPRPRSGVVREVEVTFEYLAGKSLACSFYSIFKRIAEQVQGRGIGPSFTPQTREAELERVQRVVEDEMQQRVFGHRRRF